jgi:ATP-binding cassette subfamily C protein
MSESSQVLRSAGAFVAMLVRVLRWRLAVSAMLALALAIAEGTGLLLLVPLLGSLGLAVHDGPASGIATLTVRGFGALGLQPSLGGVLLVFLAISVVHAALYRIHLLYNPTLEQHVTRELRSRLYRAILGARWPYLARQRTTDLVHAVTIDMDRVSSATYQLLTFLTGLAVSATYVAIAARMSPELTGLVALCGCVLLWLLRGRTASSADTGDRYSAASRRLFGMASESIGGVKVAKSLGAEARDVAMFEGFSRSLSDAYLALLKSYGRSKLRLDISIAIVISALLFIAVNGLGLRGAGLLVLVFVFARVMPRIVSLQEAGQVFISSVPSFTTVTRLIDACEAETEGARPDDGRRVQVGRGIVLEDVSYAYRVDGPTVVQHASLAIPGGRITAIAGPSGAGKSTIADLLLGLLPPTGGRLLVDGRELGEGDVGAWRRSIGYVPQDSFLLHDTIRANLAWANPCATEAEMWDALERAAATAFVRSRPVGLDAIVGDRGLRLSGGERQRLALARALITNPNVLVLDEATSALDSANEEQILTAVEQLRGHVTVVLISHRLSTLRNADVVYVMEAGRVAESGTWTELAARPGGVFASLLSRQAIHGQRPSESSHEAIAVQRPASSISDSSSSAALK